MHKAESVCLKLRHAFPMVLICVFGNLVLLPAQRIEQSAALPKDKTIVDMTQEELLQYYSSELRNIKFISDQGETNSILTKVGERVQQFFKEFSNTSSKENVVLQILNYNGAIDSSRIQEFRYLTLYHPVDDKPLLEEYRTDSKNRPVNSNALPGFFMTSGYACFSLNFHPLYRETSKFRYVGRQTAKASPYIIAFAQRPGMEGLPVIYTDAGTGKVLRLPVQGLAWIASDTYQILRLRIDLIPSGNESPIRRQTTTVQFSNVKFENSSKELWLPLEVVVSTTLAIPMQFYSEIRETTLSFRNVHRYSDYRLFAVESDYRIEQPKTRK